MRRTVENAAAVMLTFFWRLLPAFCLAELHLIPVFRRLCYTATVCCAPKLRLRKLIYYTYEKVFIRLLTAGAGSALTGSHYADRCDLFLGFVNDVARLQ